MMEKLSALLRGLLMPLVLSALILFSTMLLAQRVIASQIYRSSKIITMLVQQESIDIPGMLGDSKNFDLVINFAGALASAYINFELIPVNEASTFVEVFESLPDTVEVTGFSYQRKDLIIYGAAESPEAYSEFLNALRGRDYFESVTGHGYLSTDGMLKFELRCSAKTVETHLDFDIEL